MENILPNALYIFNVLGRSVIFPDLGIVAYVQDILWGLAAHCSLVTRGVRSRGAPYVG